MVNMFVFLFSIFHVACSKSKSTEYFKRFFFTYKVNISYLILEQEKRWQGNSDRTKQLGGQIVASASG